MSVKFTSATAPRTGGLAGRKVKLAGQSLKVIEALLKDFAVHGAKAVQIMRMERPSEYVKCVADLAARLSLTAVAEQVINDVPTILIVKWSSPNGPAPPPPPEVFSSVSPFSPPALTFLPSPSGE